jgi:hypothetical protein
VGICFYFLFLFIFCRRDGELTVHKADDDFSLKITLLIPDTSPIATSDVAIPYTKKENQLKILEMHKGQEPQNFVYKAGTMYKPEVSKLIAKLANEKEKKNQKNMDMASGSNGKNISRIFNNDKIEILPINVLDENHKSFLASDDNLNNRISITPFYSTLNSFDSKKTGRVCVDSRYNGSGSRFDPSSSSPIQHIDDDKKTGRVCADSKYNGGGYRFDPSSSSPVQHIDDDYGDEFVTPRLNTKVLLLLFFIYFQVFIFII